MANKMDITFSAANTAGLNNPGTEIITLVKDGSGNFINPPSYDKMRAYLRSGEVLILFVADEAGETGNLYQLDGYSETENKIRFSNDKTAIEFSAGTPAPVVSDVVPKPLTYDYMPEGYPTKSVQTTTLMEEQELAFTPGEEGGASTCYPANPFEIVEGKTYVVNWDGTDYECVCVVYYKTILSLGNKSINGAGDDTGEPFLYLSSGVFATHETAASHTISVKRINEIVTPIDEKYLPESAFADADWDFVSNRPFFNNQLNANITVENITKTLGTGDAYVSLGVPVPNFNEGLYYKVEGEITFLNNSANTSYTLQINGYYKADLQAQISLGTVHDASIGNNLKVSLYGNNSLTTYAGKLAVYLIYNSPVSYTISTNFTIISEVKQLSEDYIPNTIQRVGDDIILSSSTADSTKKFKITVDDSGTISATEVT